MPMVPKLKRAFTQLSARIGSAVSEPAARRRLNGRVLPANPSPFAVYFADTPEGRYQLLQWLAPLERLAVEGAAVTVLLSNASTARPIMDATTLPVQLCTTSAELESFVEGHRVQVIFYVNNNQANFTVLRLNGLVHVHLSHGESEKSSMVSNQLKAYDFAFIAGEASRSRIMAAVSRIDPHHLVEIGRPQLDFATQRADRSPDAVTVLYAPTWEGDSSQMAYGSLAEHGVGLCKALLADPRIRLIFRPHPKTGSLSAAHARARKRVEHLIRTAPAASASRTSVTDVSSDPIDLLAAADVVVADVSAMAMDAVGLGKPSVLLLPSAPPANGPASGQHRILDYVPAWHGVPAEAADLIVALANGGEPEQQAAFRDHVFGERCRGTGTQRFILASRELLGEGSVREPAS
ncbi:CDP-glycerol glycerophosphotransferase family protein [Paeniglutamicibacter cryotolerans]|uniref:Glycosyl transferase n=1 Tax=Paeniglutamicibacter cryotolerans TaxID=670079 RepID=A0A839QTX3_9MICC|nr:CDP-glycerol glycerophosphotransferase family protein [Paeniglutamicibacter cryotolerans]MBB2997416.1 hypothetical protein [Paeniglutamicibacter cryotolerans]